MMHFKNILYVIHGTHDEPEGLSQALSLAGANQADMTILVICPKFPGNMPAYRAKYEQALMDQARQSVEAACASLGIEEGALKLSYQLESGVVPTIRIIQYVLNNGHDIVIKEVEKVSKRQGFKALDMGLLSKCPCPVWLCRPPARPENEVRIGVAIDPTSENPSSHQMSLRMMQLAADLSKESSGALHIVSCWDFPLEAELKNNIFLGVTEEELEGELNKAHGEHHTALEALVEEARLKEDGFRLHHLRGRPEEQIIPFVEDEGIDILIMGTVARTGIPGFLLGNTAEDIFQHLPSSLIALKPEDFVCPVKG